jgi:hypothetical protein
MSLRVALGSRTFPYGVRRTAQEARADSFTTAKDPHVGCLEPIWSCAKLMPNSLARHMWQNHLKYAGWAVDTNCISSNVLGSSIHHLGIHLALSVEVSLHPATQRVRYPATCALQALGLGCHCIAPCGPLMSQCRVGRMHIDRHVQPHLVVWRAQGTDARHPLANAR